VKLYDIIKNQPTFWTFEQLKTIVIRLMKSSKIRCRQAKFKKHIHKLFEEVNKINEFNSELNTKIESDNSTINLKLDKTINQLEKITKEMNLKIQFNQDTNDQINTKIKNINIRLDNMITEQEKIYSKIEKINSKVAKQEL